MKSKDTKADDVEDVKICMTNIQSIAVYLQVVQMKVKSGNWIVIPTYALLGSWSQSTLIKEDFLWQLNLKEESTTINIISIKDKGEEVKVYVNQYSLRVSGKCQIQPFDIKTAFYLPKHLFNMQWKILSSAKNQRLFTRKNRISKHSLKRDVFADRC